MLKSIELRDFVIVRELSLDFTNGFTVLTGETGAGKSILIDALQLALGARGEASLVREGASRAEIATQFDTPESLRPWLHESGFDNDAHLLLRRSIDAQGKSRAWINGSAATLSQLRTAAEHLVDIHGQHAWARLTQSAELRRLLDAFGKIDTEPASRAHADWRMAQAALLDAQAAQDKNESERERLAWQLAELSKLAPQQGEWEQLASDHQLQSNAQTLLDTAHAAHAHLSGTKSSPGAIEQLEKSIQLLQNNELLPHDLRGLFDVLASNLASISDVAHSLAAFVRKTSPNPELLAKLDSRMSQWHQLARRFRRTPEQLHELLVQWQSELQQLEKTNDLAHLQAQQTQAHQALLQACQTLSKQRQAAAPQLAKAVSAAMQGLGMKGGRFEVQLTPIEPSAHGVDAVDFLIAGHAGSSARPLGKVASGGELSRIALAIAVTTSQLGHAQTLIFDEVDSGIGGAVAETVGQLMRRLGQGRQVLAVTHLPQVAACANAHLLVKKNQNKTQLSSAVQALEGEQRVSEIARMLGGEKLSGSALAHAQEMLDACLSVQ